MKIQELAIIFIIIILPISLLLSEYTQFQIQTIGIQTEYDARLTDATYDAIRAFQLNASNSSTSDLANSKMRDLEASIKTFRNSIMTGFELNGYTEEDLNNYIPALVYTLYDGFYIYSPYENTHGEDGNRIPGGGDSMYGLKPYINYSCRYVKGENDVVITYALDNHITVQGKIEDEYVNKSGYLIDGIEYDEINGIVKYNGIEIKTEHLKEEVLGTICSYVKVNGTKYYLYDNKIVYVLNGELKIQTSEPQEVNAWKIFMENNDNAKTYYREAYEFTKWFRGTSLVNLTYGDAIDEIIDNNGVSTIGNVWNGNSTEIFKKNSLRNIENELSNFNQHRLNVIRHKIETNLAIAISNYNTYSKAASNNVFQMPKLKEYEWDSITHNISVISFLQGLHIGGKVYNGYSLVTNTESKEVVTEENIYILGRDTENNKLAYHKIGDKGFEVTGTIDIDANTYHGLSEYGTLQDKYRSAGRLNLDFKKCRLTVEDARYYYYYPLKDYDASYDSVVMQNNVTTYEDIYEYVNGQSDKLKEAFYTALGRERNGMYKSVNSIKYYSVVMAGFTSESSYTTFNRHAYYITNKLNEDANIRATYFASPNGTDLINYITQQKDKCDLIIINAFCWNMPPQISSQLEHLSDLTNIITIANDTIKNQIQFINTDTYNGSTRVTPKITSLGEEELKNWGTIGSDVDTQYGIRFKDGVKVLYTGQYTGGLNGEYDLIGCFQKEKNKWIHSQYNFSEDKSNNMNLLKELIKYAIK